MGVFIGYFLSPLSLFSLSFDLGLPRPRFSIDLGFLLGKFHVVFDLHLILELKGFLLDSVIPSFRVVGIIVGWVNIIGDVFGVRLMGNMVVLELDKLVLRSMLMVLLF